MCWLTNHPNSGHHRTNTGSDREPALFVAHFGECSRGPGRIRRTLRRFRCHMPGHFSEAVRKKRAKQPPVAGCNELQDVQEHTVQDWTRRRWPRRRRPTLGACGPRYFITDPLLTKAAMARA